MTNGTHRKDFGWQPSFDGVLSDTQLHNSYLNVKKVA